MSRTLTNIERRNRDIYNYVRGKESERVGSQQKYRYAAILEMAQVRFYLAPDTIADIVRDYVPPEPDPAQLNMFKSDRAPAAQ